MVNLRTLQLKDAEGMLEWISNADLVKNFGFDSSNMNLQKVQKFIEESQMNDKNKHFAIVSETDEYLGTISLKNIDPVNKNGEYAIALREKAIGAGAAREATKLLLDLAFHEFKLEKVYLNVLSENKRAIRFYEKIGFLYEGEFKKHLYAHGRFHDIRWYAIFNGGISNEKI